MSATAVVLIRFSATSSETWSQLAESLEVEVRGVTPGDLPALPNAAAVVIAAAGVEREAMAWLEGRNIPAGVPVFLIGADQGRRIGTQAVHSGARDYFALPEDGELLHNAIASAVARFQEATARGRTGEDADAKAAFKGMVGQDPGFVAVMQRAAQLAQHSAAVAFILGEDGSGKEMLARAIHAAGDRAGAPFVPVNCSALPPHLVAAELFGREEQRAGGTRETTPGLFEVANGGTLYLDEVASLPVDVQARLLRILDTGEVTRVGATKSRRIDVRVLAGSSEDVERAINRGTLRRDLSLRLGVTISFPPLRDRGEDVLIIAQELLQTLAALHRVPVPDFTPDTRRALLEYRWPGNVRELKNALERALLLSPPRQLNVAELFPVRPHRSTPPGGLPFPAELDEITAAAATAMFDVSNGNLSEAARRLGISRSRLRRLLRAASGVQVDEAVAAVPYQERGMAS